jgi:hypothetical protein
MNYVQVGLAIDTLVGWDPGRCCQFSEGRPWIGFVNYVQVGLAINTLVGLDPGQAWQPTCWMY